MNTSVRVLGIALAVLMLAARGFADEVEERASSRTPSQGDHVAQVLVIVPENAEVWFEGVQTRQTGSQRTFWSPVLTPGKTYSYTLRAEMKRDGRPRNVKKTIDVRAGQPTEVTLNFDNANRDEEQLNAPPPDEQSTTRKRVPPPDR